ncbi:MAG: DUF1905 domain-containing protein [Anaerolineae bacterium]|nr:DUF1905 domain-containing protein [Anaerolineae bacterium]
MHFEFEGEIIHWRGPAPFYFVAMPDDDSQFLKSLSNQVTYGWGVIPVDVTIGKTAFYTALIPKDGRYLVPLKDAVRKAEKLDEGDRVAVQFDVRTPG